MRVFAWHHIGFRTRCYDFELYIFILRSSEKKLTVNSPTMNWRTSVNSEASAIEVVNGRGKGLLEKYSGYEGLRFVLLRILRDGVCKQASKGVIFVYQTRFRIYSCFFNILGGISGNLGKLQSVKPVLKLRQLTITTLPLLRGQCLYSGPDLSHLLIRRGV